MRASGKSDRSVSGSYEAFRSYVYGWLARKRVPHEDREDLAQDVWQEVLRRPEVVRNARVTKAVIHTIAHARFVDYVRRRRRDPQVLLSSLPSVAPILSRTASSKIGWKRLVARCRDNLGDPISKRILTLLFENGMLPAEIAAVLEVEGFRNKRGGSVSSNSVSQRIRREIFPALGQLTAPIGSVTSR